MSYSLVICCRSYLLQKLTRCSLQNCLLLIAEVALCKKSLANRYEKTSETNVYLKPLKIVELYLFILYFQLTKTRGRFRVKYNYHRKIIMLVQVDYLQQNLSTKNYIYYKTNNTNNKLSNPYLANLLIESHTPTLLPRIPKPTR